MTERRVALVGYPAEYFHPFATALENDGFGVFWICALHVDAQFLQSCGVPPQRILDTTLTFRIDGPPAPHLRTELADFENPEDPRINDIVLMDRLVSRKDWQFSIRYLHHLATSISAFYASNRITFVSSWRDTAMQIVAMLAARRHGIPYVVPTRIRIPQEMYGFCTTHHTDSFVPLREMTDADAQWARTFLSAFEGRAVRPALKKSSRTFVDVLRLMPSHLRAFRYELRRSFSDPRNDYSRYPLGRLIAMYARRRANLLLYKLVRPAERELPADQPFCLYALHTQPESSIDVQGSFFSDQVELVRHIARSLPASHVLYVKVHPTDVDGKTLAFYRRLKSIPSVVLVDYAVDSRSLLERASIVFALTGTIAYEAGLMQKPVVVFARNFFNALPTVHHCEAPPALPGLVDRLLTPRADDADRRAEIVAFLARLRSACVEGEVSRTYGASNEPLRSDDLQQARRAYQTVYRVLTEGHAR